MAPNRVPTPQTAVGHSGEQHVTVIIGGLMFRGTIEGTASLTGSVGAGALDVSLDSQTLSIAHGPFELVDQNIYSSTVHNIQPSITATVVGGGYRGDASIGGQQRQYLVRPTIDSTVTISDGVPTLVVNSSVSTAVRSMRVDYGLNLSVSLTPMPGIRVPTWLKALLGSAAAGLGIATIARIAAIALEDVAIAILVG